MAEGGDSRAGFSTRVDLEHALVHSRCWGFWGEDLASAWKSDVLAAVLQVKGPSFGVLLDLNQFSPQRPAVQDAVRAVAVTIASLKPSGAVLLAGNAITKLQIVRLLREGKCEGWSFRSGASEALEWLQRLRSGGAGHVGR